MFVDRTSIGKYRTRRIARLFDQSGKIDAAAIQPRWRAGFQPPDSQWQFPQARRQRVGGRIAGPAAFIIGQANVNPSGQEGAGR